MGCLISIGYFPQQSPVIGGSCVERDLRIKASYHHRHTYPHQLKTSYVSSPPCSTLIVYIFAALYQYHLKASHISLPPCPPAPMNHVKISNGWSLRDASSELVQLWYKTLSPNHDGLVEMKNPTRLNNKASTA